MPQQILIKRSAATTPASLQFGELACLDDVTNDIKLYLGDSASAPILINPRPFLVRYDKTFGVAQNILTGTTYNFCANLSAADVSYSANINPSLFVFAGSPNFSLRFPNYPIHVSYVVQLRLTGSITGTATTDREFSIQMIRPDGVTVLLSSTQIKLDGTALDKFSTTFATYTANSVDQFITNGVRFALLNNSGTTITVNSVSLLIFGQN